MTFGRFNSDDPNRNTFAYYVHLMTHELGEYIPDYKLESLVDQFFH